MVDGMIGILVIAIFIGIRSGVKNWARKSGYYGG